MKLTGYKIQPVELVYLAPVRIAQEICQQRKTIYVTLFSGSESGVGEISPVTAFGAESAENALQAAEQICAALYSISQNRLFTLDDFYVLADSFSACSATVSGIEQAFLQLYSNAVNYSIKSIYGLTHIEEIEVNALVSTKNAEKMPELCKAAWDQGYKTIKLKVGNLLLKEELRVLENIRMSLPNSLILRLDANAQFMLPDAVLRLKEYRQFQIEYIEQPVLDIDDFQKIKDRVDIALAADESIQSIAGAYKILSNDAVDYFILKPSQLGTLRAVLPLVHDIESMGKSVVITHSLESGIGRRKAIVCAAACLFKTSHGLSSVYSKGGIADVSYPVVDGKINISTIHL